jgi:arylformamidase
VKIYDISRTIGEDMTSYPGNPLVELKQVSKASPKSSALTKITIGSHTGTHVDAPSHIKKGSAGVDKVSLKNCTGKAIVLNLTKIPFGSAIESKHLEKKGICKGDIVLFKTKNSSLTSKKFKKDFIYLSMGGANWLAKKKVKAVGIDYLSIQKFHSGGCFSHSLLMKGILIYEGLLLKGVPASSYQFFGFPIKIKNGDGAPVRVVLIK